MIQECCILLLSIKGTDTNNVVVSGALNGAFNK